MYLLYEQICYHTCNKPVRCERCMWTFTWRVQESGKVSEENAVLRQQLADIQASLSKVNQSQEDTLQDAQVSL